MRDRWGEVPLQVQRPGSSGIGSCNSRTGGWGYNYIDREALRVYVDQLHRVTGIHGAMQPLPLSFKVLCFIYNIYIIVSMVLKTTVQVNNDNGPHITASQQHGAIEH